MFLAITSGNLTRVVQLSQSFSTEKISHPAALLGFHHYFNNFPRIQISPSPEVAQVLADFLVYTRLLCEMAFDPDPCNNPTIQKLFAIQVSTDNAFIVPSATYLYRILMDTHTSVLRSNDEGTLVSDWELSRTIRRCIWDHLRQKVLEENEICRKTRAFSVCLSFLVLGSCARRDCHREHRDSTTINSEWFNIRVRLHLQQVLVFQTLHSTIDNQERMKQQRYKFTHPSKLHTDMRACRYWLEQLYEVMNPSFYMLGTSVNLDVNCIPEVSKGLQVVKYWARDLLYSISARPHPGVLTMIIRAANLSFKFDHKEAANYVYSAPAVNAFSALPEYCRGPERKRIMQELVGSLDGTHDWFISGGFMFVR